MANKIKSVTMSFSIPVELSILMEEHMENEKIKRSEVIKKAIELYLKEKESTKENNKLIHEIYNNVLEIKNSLIKK